MNCATYLLFGAEVLAFVLLTSSIASDTHWWTSTALCKATGSEASAVKTAMTVYQVVVALGAASLAVRIATRIADARSGQRSAELAHAILFCATTLMISIVALGRVVLAGSHDLFANAPVRWTWYVLLVVIKIVSVHRVIVVYRLYNKKV
jgi:hypothetical protein